MLLDFNQMETTVIPSFKGGKGSTAAQMYVDPMNRIMVGRLEPGCSIGMHTHDTSSEIVYVLSGTATWLYDDTVETGGPGCCHYCPKGHAHSTVNNGTEDLIFFAAVPQQ